MLLWMWLCVNVCVNLFGWGCVCVLACLCVYNAYMLGQGYIHVYLPGYYLK